MHIRRTADTLTLRNSPGCAWAGSLWFLGGGLLCLVLLVVDGGDLSLRDRAIVFLIGGGVLAGGIYLLASSPRVLVEFDLAARRLRVHSRAPFRRAVRLDVPVSQVQGYTLRESRDSEGDPWYQLYLTITGMRPILLTGAAHHSRESLNGVCHAVSEALAAMRD